MKAPETIPRSGTTDTCTNYQELLRRGLSHCQELSGDLWTDYNEHDPGVTILEQLCFALTDLSYRTDFEIPDILAAAPGRSQPEQAIYSGDKILTCKALTPSDYRKLLYDRIKGLKNAWLVPVTDHSLGIQGLYKVLVETREEIEDQPDEIAEVCRKVKCLMRAERNLGEDVYEVVMLKRQPIWVEGTIEIGPKVEPANVLAQVLFEIQNSLIPFPQVQRVDQLFHGTPPDQIWNGPLLDHGALDEKSLKKIRRTIHLQEISDIMLRIPGVKRVKRLKLAAPGTDRAKPSEEPIALQKDHVPRLDPPVLKPQTSYSITVELEGGFKCLVDSRMVWSRIQELEAAMRKNIAYAARSLEALSYLQPPAGNYRRIGDYHSIQHQFPAVYGLSKYGMANNLVENGSLPLRPDPVRAARIRQLKAYLLFFEQPMADYLAQLSHVADLFSLEEDLHQSYFYQPLAHDPPNPSEPQNIAEILSQRHKTPGEESPGPEFDGEESGEHFGEEKIRPLRRSHGVEKPGRNSLRDYYEGLDRIGRRMDRNYLRRRNRILDHLLARFGERFDDAILERLDLRPYGRKDDFYRELIRWKIEFLRGYIERRNVPFPALGAGRAQGFDYGAEDPGSVSGLERRVSLLLGLHGHADDGEYHSRTENPTLDPGYFYLEKYVRQRDQEQLKDEKGGSLRLIHEQIISARAEGEPDLTDLHQNFVFSSEDSSVFRQLLSYGVNRENYRLRQTGGEYHVLFQSPNSGRAMEIHHAHTRHEAEKAVDSLIRYFQQLKQQGAQCYAGESMHVVEHVLLRPYDQSNKDLHHLQPDTADKPEQPKAEDEFYSHRVSVFFPNWPMRIQNNEFKLYAEQVIYENAPAHLAIECFWLSAHEMREFERLFGEWKALRRNAQRREEHGRGTEPNPVPALDAVAARLRAMIQKIEKQQREAAPQAGEP